MHKCQAFFCEDESHPPTLQKASEIRQKILMEAAPGFEPGMGVLQTPALPLGYVALLCGNLYSIRGDLDKGKICPTEFFRQGLWEPRLKS